MNREEAEAYKVEINALVDKHSKRLQQFETNQIGLVPDHIRATEEWKQANQDFNRSFAELRRFNSWYVKTFMKKGKGKKKPKESAVDSNRYGEIVK